MTAAAKVFPELDQICGDSGVPQDETADDHPQDKRREIPELDPEMEHMRVGLENVILSSGAGSLGFSWIVLVIGTLATIGAYVWLTMSFQTKYCDDMLVRNRLVIAMEEVFANLGYLIFFTSELPYVQLPLVSKVMPTLVDVLAPSIQLPEWDFGRSVIPEWIGRTRRALEDMSGAIGDLRNGEDSAAAFTLLFRDDSPNGIGGEKAFLKALSDIDELSLLLETPGNTVQEQAWQLVGYISDRRFVGVNTFASSVSPYDFKMLSLMVDQAKLNIDGQRQQLAMGWSLSTGLVALLMAIPFTIIYSSVYVTGCNIAHIFDGLPNTVVRTVVTGDANVKHHVILATTGHRGEWWKVTAVFVLSFIFVVVFSFILLIVFDSDIEESIDAIDRLRTVHEPVIVLLRAMYRLSHVMILKGLFADPQYSALLAAKFTDSNRNAFNISIQMDTVQDALRQVEPVISDQIFGRLAPIGIWLRDDPSLTHFDDELPFNTPGSRASCSDLTELEYHVTCDLASLCYVLYHSISRWASQILDKDLTIFNFMSIDSSPFVLMYLFTGWAEDNRFGVFQSAIVEDVRFSMDSKYSMSQTLLILLCIIQVVVLLVIIFFLLSETGRLSHALRFLLCLNPADVLENSAVMAFLSYGTVSRPASIYGRSETVLEYIREGVVMCTTDLVVQDLNDSFARLLEVGKGAIRATPLADWLKSRDRNSAESFVVRLAESLRGSRELLSQETIRIAVPSSEKLVSVFVSYLDEVAVADGETPIVAVLLLFSDLTDAERREEQIRAEEARVRGMLEGVIPQGIVSELGEGSRTISFAVQIATIGFVEIVLDKIHFEAMDTLISKWSAVFEMLDAELKEFGQLTKVRTTRNIYVLAGGLFAETNKPKKHADDAVRFCLKILAQTGAISARLGFEVDFVMGLHTGGPLVAGIVSNERPWFQLIGAPMETTEDIIVDRAKGHAYVTRAVYELIYSHGFRVTESENRTLRSGKGLQTYVVRGE
jgi:PAS domain-containing protein